MAESDWFSWTVDLQKKEFIHLRYTENLRPLFETTMDIPVWWNEAVGIHRVKHHVGHTFKIIGSSSVFSDSNLVTKGIILSTDPLIVSGSTKKHDILPFDITFDQLAQAIENYDSDSNGNITHLLKAPINRIRGLTGILIQELKISDNDAVLLEYLKDSANRLSSIFSHVLSGAQLSPTGNSTSIGSVLDEANRLLQQVFDLKGFKYSEETESTEISTEVGKMLHEVSIRIMLHNAFSKITPTVTWKQIDEAIGIVSLEFENYSPHEEIDFMSVTGIAPPPNSVKVLPGSLVIHEIRDDITEYKIILNLS